MAEQRTSRTCRSTTRVPLQASLVSGIPSTSSVFLLARPGRAFESESLRLLGIKFDDQLFVERRSVQIFAPGHGDDFGPEIFAVDIEPRHGALALGEVAGLKDHGVFLHAVLHGDLIAHADEKVGDVDLAAVDADVAVKDELAALRARGGNAGAIEHVIETPLEHDHEVRAGGPVGALSLLEVGAELALEQAVGTLHFLFFAQLHAVANHFCAARLAVLAGNEIALFNGTLFRKATQAFEEKLHAFSPAEPANRFTMSCQFPVLL